MAEPQPLSIQGEIVAFSGARLKQAARRLIHLRKRRGELFGVAIAREVAWDMLLELYVSDRRFSVGQLTRAVGAPQTTAIRWLEYLEQRGMVKKSDHPTDGRVIFVEITQDARAALEKYLIEAQ